MLSLNRRGCVTVALLALAGLAGIATADARGEEARERQEHRPSEAQRQGAWREAQTRQGHRTYAAQTHAAANHRPEMVGRSIRERHFADGSIRRDTHLAGGGQVREVSHGPGAQQVRVVRYGNAVSGTVERSIRPGLVSRTFVSGGHVLYTRVYEHHAWQHFGTAFAYETFVPAVRYPAIYYGWALAAWPHPITYRWGWQVQPWYPAYGVLFTAYPAYTSPDLWMTDYIIAQSMRTAYQAQSAAPAAAPYEAQAPAAPAPDAAVAPPAAEPGAVPVVQPSEAIPTAQSSVPPAPQPKAVPPALPATPPAVTPQIKAQLNAQIKVQLQEQEAAVATPATMTSQSTPPALRPNHVFYQVVQPLDVPSGSPNRYCSLSPDDYIKRTGGMSSDDWMIPVVVELSGPSDCPAGLHTRIGLNDLNAMENEQEAQVMEALREASRSMGPNGPPGGSGVHPTLIADGSAAPDPGALDAIRRAQ